MSLEDNILFENIKNFRQLITEGVGENDIINAIQNHEWLNLYYEGDGEHKKGIRVVRPYVLGTSKRSGARVLRAWQDNKKNSHDFENKPRRNDKHGGMYHDFWTDSEGEKPGWRMFRVDKISRVLPIGEKFNDSNGLVMIPAGYHEGGDKDMSSVDYWVSTKTEPDFEYEFDREVNVDAVTPNDKKAKWDSIRRGNKNKTPITKDDVIVLRNQASKVSKKAHSKYIVVVDDRDNFRLITATDKIRENIPDLAILGSLTYLKDTILKDRPQGEDIHYFNSTRDALARDIKNKERKGVKENDSPTIPYNKNTFFK